MIRTPTAPGTSGRIPRTVTRPIRVTSTDREGIVTELLPRAEAISRDYHTQGYEAADWAAEARALLVTIVDSWLSREGAHARTLGITLEQYVIRRLRLRLMDRWRHLAAANRILDHAVSLDLFLHDGAAPDEVTVPGPGPLGPDLETALSSLTPRERRVVRRHLVEGYTVAETAELVGCSVNAVHHSLKQARKKLRGHLADYLYSTRK